jgi:hypothetical protein
MLKINEFGKDKLFLIVIVCTYHFILLVSFQEDQLKFFIIVKYIFSWMVSFHLRLLKATLYFLQTLEYARWIYTIKIINLPKFQSDRIIFMLVENYHIATFVYRSKNIYT